MNLQQAKQHQSFLPKTSFNPEYNDGVTSSAPSFSLSDKLTSRICACGSLFYRRKCECGHDWSGKTSLCGLNYCVDPHCSNYRELRIFHRFRRLGIHSKRMFHMVVGFPTMDHFPSKKEMAEIKEILNRFEQKVRRLKDVVVGKNGKVQMKSKNRPVTKQRYAFRFIRVFDVSYDPVEKTYFVHFHYAILPEAGLGKWAGDVNACLSEAAGTERVAKQFGAKNTRGLLKYLAKRAAGIFGHDHDPTNKTEYGYPAFMGIDEYAEKVHRTHTISVSGLRNVYSKFDVECMEYLRKFPNGRSTLAEAIGSTIRISTQNYCPKCGGFNIVGILLPSDFVKTRIPPNWADLDFDELLSLVINGSDDSCWARQQTLEGGVVYG